MSTFTMISAAAFLLATALLPLMWNCRAEDPRVTEARRKRRNMRAFWKIDR